MDANSANACYGGESAQGDAGPVSGAGAVSEAERDEGNKAWDGAVARGRCEEGSRRAGEGDGWGLVGIPWPVVFVSSHRSQ
jgi:hypothetical protein